MGLDEATMTRYLEAMPPRTAARIMKEFKTPDEVNRIHRVMERMRLAATQPSPPAPGETPPPASPAPTSPQSASSIP
jgi:hypothetical protein